MSRNAGAGWKGGNEGLEGQKIAQGNNLAEVITTEERTGQHRQEGEGFLASSSSQMTSTWLVRRVLTYSLYWQSTNQRPNSAPTALALFHPIQPHLLPSGSSKSLLASPLINPKLAAPGQITAESRALLGLPAALPQAWHQPPTHILSIPKDRH